MTLENAEKARRGCFSNCFIGRLLPAKSDFSAMSTKSPQITNRRMVPGARPSGLKSIGLEADNFRGVGLDLLDRCHNLFQISDGFGQQDGMVQRQRLFVGTVGFS